jgi:transcriptional regulator with XRE-family HTH domain
LPREPRTPETRAIGLRIRDERTRAGLSRGDFAKLIPTSPKQVNRIEQGYRTSAHRLAKIAKVLGLSYDYIMTGAGPRIAPDLGTPAGERSGERSGELEEGLEQMLRRIIRDEIRRTLGQWPGSGPEILSRAGARTSRGGRGAAGRRRRGSPP